MFKKFRKMLFGEGSGTNVSAQHEPTHPIYIALQDLGFQHERNDMFVPTKHFLYDMKGLKIRNLEEKSDETSVTFLLYRNRDKRERTTSFAPALLSNPMQLAAYVQQLIMDWLREPQTADSFVDDMPHGFEKQAATNDTTNSAALGMAVGGVAGAWALKKLNDDDEGEAEAETSNDTYDSDSDGDGGDGD